MPGTVPVNELLCSKLRVAREALCVAQVELGMNTKHRQLLQDACDEIDLVGVFNCDSWSRFDMPSVEGQGS